MTAYSTNETVLAAHVELAGKQVIDVGAGAGGLVRWLREQGAHPTAVECGEVMLARARALDPDHADDYIDAVGQDLPMADASADIVTFVYSLHHIPNDQMRTALAEAFRVLRPGGTRFVTEPVATGSGHEVDRLIDDETPVRASAQEALRSAESLGFERLHRGEYTTLSAYVDFDEYESLVVGIDPGRAAAMDLHREEARERFETNAHLTPEGAYTFEGPCVFDVFVKPGV